MTRKVLNVGQCAFDTGQITNLLTKHFSVEITPAADHSSAVQLAKQSDFDLILINRVLDSTGTEGMEVLQALKDDPTTQQTPVMIVSNFAEAQDAAVQAGAVPGFGKSSINDEATVDNLRQYLAS